MMKEDRRKKHQMIAVKKKVKNAIKQHPELNGLDHDTITNYVKTLSAQHRYTNRLAS